VLALLVGVVSTLAPRSAVNRHVASDAELLNAADTVLINVVEFGIMRNNGDIDSAAFIATRVIPNIEDQEYGWGLTVRTSRHAVHVREEFDLPRPASVAEATHNAASITYSDDRRRLVIERDMRVQPGGVMWHFWTSEEDDAPGAYELRLYIEDRLVGRFPYVLEPRAAPRRGGNGVCTKCNKVGSLDPGATSALACS